MTTFRDKNDFNGIKLPQGVVEALMDLNSREGGLAASAILKQSASEKSGKHDDKNNSSEEIKNNPAAQLILTVL